MNTTYEELGKLFRLTDHDHRSLRTGLKNKVRALKGDDVLVKDDELKALLTDFRMGGTLTLQEASREFGVPENLIQRLVKNKVISSYQLVAAQGSKTLFLRAELEKEQNLLLVHTEKEDPKRLAKLTVKLMRVQMEPWRIKEREVEMFEQYYIKDLTLEQIGKEHGISRERARQVLQKAERGMLNRYEKAFNNMYHADYDKKEKERLQKKYNKLLGFVEGLEHIRELLQETGPGLPPKKGELRFRDMNLSIRTLNCLKVNDVETVGDLLKFEKEDLLKMRNFGKGSMKELEAILAEMGIAL